MKKAYFAHSWRLKDTEREKKLIDALSQHFEIINPFDSEAILEKKYGAPYYSNITPAFATDIVKNDFDLIEKADCVIAYITHKQIGTLFEICYAAITLKKTVYVISFFPSPFFLGIEHIKFFKNIRIFKNYLRDGVYHEIY